MKKPMTTHEHGHEPGDPRAQRAEKAQAHMTDPAIAERIRAAHPHAAENDELLAAALADYDRLVGEQARAV